MITVISRRLSFGQNCDYCTCKACQREFSIPCADGSRICQVCFFDEPCYRNEKHSCEFCDNHPFCEHKPEIIIEGNHETELQDKTTKGTQTISKGCQEKS